MQEMPKQTCIEEGMGSQQKQKMTFHEHSGFLRKKGRLNSAEMVGVFETLK